MATSPPTTPSLRWVPGEVEGKTTTARFLLPTSTAASWTPFTRIVESVATNARQPPPHGHEAEEVLTYMFEGYADYQFESNAVVSLPPGSVCLLSAVGKATHRITPSKGSTVRWMSTILTLPSGTKGETKVQTGTPRSSEIQSDGTILRDLVGPGSTLVARSGLVAREVQFAQGGTTFQRMGHGRRGFAYSLAGRGAVDSQPVQVGEGVLIEGASGVAIHGQPGFRIVIGSAPVSA